MLNTAAQPQENTRHIDSIINRLLQNKSNFETARRNYKDGSLYFGKHGINVIKTERSSEGP